MSWENEWLDAAEWGGAPSDSSDTVEGDMGTLPAPNAWETEFWFVPDEQSRQHIQTIGPMAADWFNRQNRLCIRHSYKRLDADPDLMKAWRSLSIPCRLSVMDQGPLFQTHRENSLWEKPGKSPGAARLMSRIRQYNQANPEAAKWEREWKQAYEEANPSSLTHMEGDYRGGRKDRQFLECLRSTEAYQHYQAHFTQPQSSSSIEEPGTKRRRLEGMQRPQDGSEAGRAVEPASASGTRRQRKTEFQKKVHGSQEQRRRPRTPSASPTRAPELQERDLPRPPRQPPRWRPRAPPASPRRAPELPSWRRPRTPSGSPTRGPELQPPRQLIIRGLILPKQMPTDRKKHW